MWDVFRFGFFTFVKPKCIVLILFRFNLGVLQDWKSKCKQCFPPSFSLLIFLEKKRKLAGIEIPKRQAVWERDTEVSRRGLKLKSQFLSECKPEQSCIWNGENSARQIQMAELSPLSCRSLEVFCSPTNVSAFHVCIKFCLSPSGTWHFLLPVTPKAWLCICSLPRPADLCCRFLVFCLFFPPHTPESAFPHWFRHFQLLYKMEALLFLPEGFPLAEVT